MLKSGGVDAGRGHDCERAVTAASGRWVWVWAPTCCLFVLLGVAILQQTRRQVPTAFLALSTWSLDCCCSYADRPSARLTVLVVERGPVHDILTQTPAVCSARPVAGSGLRLWRSPWASRRCRYLYLFASASPPNPHRLYRESK